MENNHIFHVLPFFLIIRLRKVITEFFLQKFSKTKDQTKKRPPKIPKNIKHTEVGLKSKSFIKQTPKVGILIQNTISKFSKIKLKKDPLKFQKIKNIYEASNQKVL